MMLKDLNEDPAVNDLLEISQISLKYLGSSEKEGCEIKSIMSYNFPNPKRNATGENLIYS